MNLIKTLAIKTLNTLANNTITVHSYCTQQPKWARVAGYIPVVGLVPAALRSLSVAMHTFRSFKGKERVKDAFHVAILQIPRAAFEASGVGVLLLPVDLAVTAVHMWMRAGKEVSPNTRGRGGRQIHPSDDPYSW